mmetsp:Transcript_22475/g.62370  ORF Transcript_22475/g.62370 Transcript_22475/m.62370 type:complete len:781 (+) Transcript_22475:100-2442(+)
MERTADSPSQNSDTSRQLRLLVCSANLGNAQPDPESLAAWIPEDGLCHEVIRSNPPFPLMMKKVDEASTRSKPVEVEFDEEEEESDDEESQFRPSPSERVVVISPEKRKKVIGSLIDWSKVLKEKMEADNLELIDGTPRASQMKVEGHDQFDIIVIGMQEATFDPPSTRPELDKGADHSFHFKIPVVAPVAKKVLAPVAQKVFKGGRKAAATVGGLTQNVDYVKQDSQHAIVKRRDWGGGSSVLHALLDSRLPSYDRLVSFQRGQMRLEVYVNCSQVDCETLHTEAQNTGRGGLANKGGIVTELLVNSTTRLSFMTAHLEAHEGHSKYKMRVQSFGKILDGTRSAKWHDVSQTSHYAFALGDLNFRTCIDPNLPKEAHKRAIQKMVEDENWHALNNADELHRTLEQKSCMVGFQTPFCNFPPTFKLVEKEGFEWQEKRRPSYTDRILWKAADQLAKSISPLIYEPIPSFRTSDHKPVRAAFVIELNEPFRLRPRIMRSTDTTKQQSARHLKLRSITLRGPNSKKQAMDKIEMWVSGISLDIHKKEGLPPNPYVAMVSCPEEVFKPKRKNRWLQDRFVQRNGAGWPCTKKRMGTFSPDYGEEEVKWKIELHQDNGMPCDMTGALMLFTVLDHRPAMEDVVIGSFSFNLVPLLSKCQDQATAIGERQYRKAESNQAQKNPRRRPSNKFVASIRRATQVFTPQHHNLTQNDGDDDPIVTTEIDEILCKNGKEIGRIRCKIESWWINAATAEAMNAKPKGGHRQSLFGRRRPTHETEAIIFENN